MILLLFLIIGLIVGIFRGGGLSGLDRMRLHAIWLILVSAIAEIALFVLQAFPSSLYPGILPAIQLARFVPLILFTLLNIKNWRICMAALGLIANFAVISVNHWQMPIGWTANNLPQFAKEIKDISTGLIPGYTVMKDAYAANLWFLADLLPVVRPEIGFASIGDILLGFGVLLTVQHGMARYSIGKHVRGSLARSAGGRTTVSNRKSMPRPQAAAPAADVSQPLAYKAEAPLSPEQNEPVGKTEPIMEAEPERKPEPEAKAQTEANAEPERKIKPKKQAELKNGEKHMPGDKPEPKQKQQKPDKRRKDDKLVAALTGIATEPQLRETSPEPMCPSDFGSTPESESSGNQQIRLSPRLQTVADMAGRMGVAADVGCDHGKLSAWLAINNDMKVIALDISSKSLAKTKLLVKQFGLYNMVQTRVSNGLKKLRPGEADVIVISGLGGPTICTILDEGSAIASTAARLVLQPMNAVGMVRRWLSDNGYNIVEEQLAEEDNRIYQILSAVPGSDACPPMSLFDLEIGHLLIDNRHPLLQKLLGYKIATIDKILSEIEDIATPKAEARRSELISLRKRCSEVLEWLAQ